MPFDPNEYEQFKAQQAAPTSGFDPAEYAASKPFLQKLADLSAVPRNGLRGIAVGAENLLEGKGVQPSLQRAAEATQQDYKPQPGETIANLAANGLDPRMLGVMAVTGGAGGLGYLKTIGQGAAMGATGAGLQDLEQSGTTTPMSVLGGAALGGATAGTLKGAGDAIAAAPNVIGDVATNFVRATGGINPGTVAAYTENPSAVKAALGTFDSQRASTQALQQGIQNRLAQLGQAVGDAKAQLGIQPPAEILDLPALKTAASDILNSPVDASPEGQLARIRQISALKDQITQQQNNLFKNGNADVLQRNINPNAEAADLKQLYGQLNSQLKSIPAAQPLLDANAAYSPAQAAFQDSLQPALGRSTGAAQDRLFQTAVADPTKRYEAMRPDMENAINAVGGDVPSLYQSAKAEATKRALDTPNARVLNNPLRVIPAMAARAVLPATIDLATALNNGVGPAAQSTGQALSSPAARLSLIQALLHSKDDSVK